MLVSVVRNESGRVGRMIQSVLPWIDSWVVLNTCSEDGTREEVLRGLGHLPGHLYEQTFNAPGEPFPFATARNRALELARAAASPGDTILFLDADETLEVDGAWPSDCGDVGTCYMLSQGGATRGMDCLTIRADLPGEFTPITHENFKAAGPAREVFLPGVRIVSHDDSARRGSGNKSRHDVMLLEPWCAEHPDDSRAQYYLAQSLWNLAMEDEATPLMSFTRALAALEKRLAMEGHPEETWMSLYLRARTLEKLGQSRPVVVDAYLTVYSADPERIEPLWCLWEYLMRGGGNDFGLMRMLANEMRGKRVPERGMYVSVETYKWYAEFAHGLSEMGLNNWRTALTEIKCVFPLLPEEQKIIAREAIRVCQERIG